MPKYNVDYLKFDAVSIKDAIKQRLSEDSDFSDHLFEGSNLTTIIDIFSHLFEVLMYYTNHGASEAMFSDAQLYENMNRIVKLLGYNPLGGLSSIATIEYYDAADAPSGTIFNDDSAQKEIPKYAYIDTGLTDTEGDTIYYSMIDRLYVSSTNPASVTNSFTAVNGQWKLYERTFIAGGAPFEEFVLDTLQVANTEDLVYIAHPHIDVYVKTLDPSLGTYVFEEYDAITEGTIFGHDSTIIGPDAQSFELRINEDGYYALKFGDGIHGKRLNEGDEVYIIYLEGNGLEGKIGANVINRDGGLNWGVAGLDTTVLLEMLNVNVLDTSFLVNDDEMDNIHFQNVSESSTYNSPEDVSSIRTNAPNALKSSNRLVTATDFENHMNANYSVDIYDVSVMNNWAYMSEFYKWLYDYDRLSIEIRSAGYEFVDSCDFNNVYIWLKYKNAELDENNVQEDLQSKKCLTAEPKLQTALDVYFVPCLNFNEDNTLPESYSNLKYNISGWDPTYENWIEIIKDKNEFVSAEKIRSEVLKAIRDFFDASINTFGQSVNFNTLYGTLLSINGVGAVRTAYLATGEPTSNTIYFNGLSFAMWTPLLIDGQDVATVKGTVALENFQFPNLYTSNISNRVKILAESFGQGSIEY